MKRFFLLYNGVVFFLGGHFHCEFSLRQMLISKAMVSDLVQSLI